MCAYVVNYVTPICRRREIRVSAQLDQPEHPFIFRLTLSPWQCFPMGQRHFGAALDPRRRGAPAASQATSVPAAAGDRDRPANVLLAGKKGNRPVIINFECRKCHREFDCEVGAVTVSAESGRPQFENALACPSCGTVSMDEVWLTEMGQGQLTVATDPVQGCTADEIEDVMFGQPIAGPCKGCDEYGTLDDIGLCQQCGAKMDRDFIRQRQWDYSVSACFLDATHRERLRADVIRQYGEKLELIAPSGPAHGRSRKRRKRTR